MAQKKSMTDDDLLAQLDNLSSAPATGTPARPKKPATTTTTTASNTTTNDDPLAELEELKSLAKVKPLSRPNTPKLASTSATGGRARSPARRTAAATTTTDSGRNSEERTARRSAESVTSGMTGGQQGLTPTSEEDMAGLADREPVQHDAQQQQEEEGQQSSWWGGILAMGTTAMKQAEAAVKEIQKNEEAQKWADQVRGNVGALKGIGDGLRSRALPTFTNIINTIAPPISQHERLQIHITHDLVGYPSLDPTVHAVFSRVMAQVEGGDLLVIQRGSETRSSSSSRAGWSDGPWWRDGLSKRDMGVIGGLVEGTKLARANADSFAHEFFASRGGIEEATKQAGELHSESNPVRSSDIFLAIQAVAFEGDSALFQAASTPVDEKSAMIEDPESDALVCFALYLHDPVHNIDFHTMTQAFPQKWADWLDAENSPKGEMQMPDEIAEIVMQGGIDPREWVSEWVEEVIGLGVGVIAQRYVAKRMGFGEAGMAKGKARRPAVESGAGELARAI